MGLPALRAVAADSAVVAQVRSCTPEDFVRGWREFARTARWVLGLGRGLRAWVGWGGGQGWSAVQVQEPWRA